MSRNNGITLAWFYVHDHLYSPAAMVVGINSYVVERYEYDAYGNCSIFDGSYNPRSESLISNPYLFTGRRLDILDNSSLKIQYNRNRYYDYYTGRFTSHDALGYIDGMNLYEYVSSRPGTLVDPFGKWGRDMHYDETKCWALEIGFRHYCAELIAGADWDVDIRTPAITHPWYHFDEWSFLGIITGEFSKGRDDYAQERWDEAKSLLSKATSEEVVYSALKYVGQALHGFQDAKSHQWEGQANIKDGKGHHAHTAWHHVFEIANLLQPHRPDNAIQFAADWHDSSLDTKAKLEEIWESCAVQCVCKGSR